jgi:phosphatidylglycerophosphate synthase
MHDVLAHRPATWRTRERYSTMEAVRDALTQAGWVGLAITVVRLGLVPIMIVSFMAAPWITALALMAFVVADVQDGVLARGRGTDGPARRALDSAVDRLAIDACLVAACMRGSLAPALLYAFLLRDFYCAWICARMMRSAASAIKADWLYRSLNLSVAAWAIAAPFVSTGARAALFALILAGGIVVALDLRDGVRQVMATPHFHGAVVPAGSLRRTRGQ